MSWRTGRERILEKLSGFSRSFPEAREGEISEPEKVQDLRGKRLHGVRREAAFQALKTVTESQVSQKPQSPFWGIPFRVQ